MKKQSYNHLYLSGDKHCTDEVYQDRVRAEGLIVPDEALYTAAVNDSYLEKYPERTDFIKKKLAIHGLLDME